MHYFEILVAFSCIFSVVIAMVESASTTYQPEEIATVRTELDDSSLEHSTRLEGGNEPSVEVIVKTNGPYGDDDTITTLLPKGIEITSNESSEEIHSNIEEATESIESKTNESSEDVDSKANASSEEIESNSKESTGGIESNTKESSQEIDIETNESSEEVDPKTNASSVEIESNDKESTEGIESITKESPEGIDIKTTEPSKEADDKTIDPSEVIITTTAPTRGTEGSVFPNQKVLGMNIGLYFVLEEIRRKHAFTGRVPMELVIKVLVLSSKIEEADGEIIPLNQNMMKILPNLLPSSFRTATCSMASLTHIERKNNY